MDHVSALLGGGPRELLMLSDFPRTKLRDAVDQLHRDRLGERKADRPLATHVVGCQVIPERRARRSLDGYTE